MERVLWNAVPNYLRKLNDVVQIKLQKSLPIDLNPIKISSWMGGDRDGNPNVDSQVTFDVSMLSRWTAANLFKKEIIKLRADLSHQVGSKELMDATKNAREPYRFVLRNLEQRLEATSEWANAKFNKIPFSSSATPVLRSSEIMEPLMLMHRSLIATGNAETADGALTDVIRRLATFGMALMPLDIRQESSRHSEALDAITRHLNLKEGSSYLQWDENTRREWLSLELASHRPLIFDNYEKMGFSDTVLDTLNTFKVIAELSPGSLNAYVISQCQQASDILAVALLQQNAGVAEPLRVVPLFETLDDLQRSATTLNALLSIPVYRNRISNHQEIMVGYSDSAKDAGRLAASWAQYNAQEAMVNVAKKHISTSPFFTVIKRKINVTTILLLKKKTNNLLGKGGTVGRGGNPALFKAILAHPPNTINGRFRVTEQGEMITQNFGQLDTAERTLDLFTSGVLTERFLLRPEPKQEWRVMMESLSQLSCEAYRQVVRGEPRFVPYFRVATPELELSRLNIGSRPAKRNPQGGVESLRAIPWVFSWTQTRLNLPTWLGVGESISVVLKNNEGVLKEAYQSWPWFNTLIDLLEMILVKSDERIAENYDVQLVKDLQSIALGKELRGKMRLARAAVLAVSGHPELQANNPVLLRSLQRRNPYIDPLNVIQCELLRRSREAAESNGTEGYTGAASGGGGGGEVGPKNSSKMSEQEKEALQDALLVTIKGIAAGMRNSG